MNRWRSPKYEAWVKQQPCINCGYPVATCHHAKGIGHLSGVSLKAPSWACMPLCEENRCHELTQSYQIQKEMQWEWIARTLGKAIEEGVLKIK